MFKNCYISFRKFEYKSNTRNLHKNNKIIYKSRLIIPIQMFIIKSYIVMFFW